MVENTLEYKVVKNDYCTIVGVIFSTNGISDYRPNPSFKELKYVNATINKAGSIQSKYTKSWDPKRILTLSKFGKIYEKIGLPMATLNKAIASIR